jgi:hypothetical protein
MILDNEAGSWQSLCDCGWVGEMFPDVLASRSDYVKHVEGALGADAYYSAPVACTNCGSEHDQELVIGTDVKGGTCTRCGCRGRLVPNNAVSKARV